MNNEIDLQNLVNDCCEFCMASMELRINNGDKIINQSDQFFANNPISENMEANILSAVSDIFMTRAIIFHDNKGNHDIALENIRHSVSIMNIIKAKIGETVFTTSAISKYIIFSKLAYITGNIEEAVIACSIAQKMYDEQQTQNIQGRWIINTRLNNINLPQI